MGLSISKVWIVLGLGLGAAVVLFLLQAGRDYFLLSLNRIDIWVTLLAFLFSVAGVWLGRTFLPRSRPIEPPAGNPVSEFSMSKRESEVLQFLLSNKSNKEICAALFIENSTLKTHINRIYRKLNVKNRQDLFSRFNNTSI